MKKLLFVLSALFLLGLPTQVRAESSAQAYEINNQRSYGVYVDAYNSGTIAIAKNSPVALDISAGTTDGTTKGAWIQGITTTDSILGFGVADEAIAVGGVGRICIRGPHKVATIIQSYEIATGQIFGTSTTINKASYYTRSDGTAGGQIGIIIGTTATTDTGDASLTYWGYVNPRFHK